MFKELNEAERFVWIGFLLLAGDSPYPGKICITKDMGYTWEQLASLLNTNTDLIGKTIDKLVQYDKIGVHLNGKIEIMNWKKYQSEYQRQKPYREKLLNEVTNQSYKPSDTVEGEGDREVEVEEERDKKKKVREKTPEQRIVLAYKVKKGFDLNDKKWDKLNFPRCSKSAKQLLEYFTSWETAVDCIDQLGSRFNHKKLDWTIETIVKNASQWEIDRRTKGREE